MVQKKRYTENRAVSPVIAVVLMIAVTVILAAIVAAFALGMGSNTSATPQASFEYDYNTTGTLVITDTGGDAIDSNWVSIQTTGTATVDSPFGPGDITAGSAARVGNLTSDDTVRVVYTNDNGKTATLSTYTVP